jgi:hypothetical protein
MEPILNKLTIFGERGITRSLTMGLMDIGQFYGEQASLAPALPGADQQHLRDIERIARALASQGTGMAEMWPSFMEPAEDLVRYSKLLIESC